MCGIYGRLGITRAIDPEDCLRRTRMLDHRGPDFCGTRQVGNLFLGHTRLSILDLTPAGNQPFTDGEALLVFNGEIYNWRELRERHLAGVALHSASDTEVLFLLLRRMGPACLPLLNGMFAFAFHDPATGSLLLARDTVGIKPLYFVADDTHFEFSSEIKNLDYVPAPDRLKEFIVFNRWGEDFLPFANVHEVHPGHCLEVDCRSGAVSAQREFGTLESRVNPDAYRRLAAGADLEDQLDAALTRSVSLHEQSDAPIGVLCSGGLDSSLVSAIVARHHPDIALYHADFEGDGSEAHYAEQVARHVGAPIRQTRIGREEFWELFPRVTWAQDVPLSQPHAVSLALVARKAQEDGLKVLLSGEGADELFGGYDWFRHYRNSLSNFGSRWRPSSIIAGLARRLLGRLEGPDSYYFFKYLSRDFQQHAHLGGGFASWTLSEPIKSLSLVGQGFHPWANWQRALERYQWLPDAAEGSVQAFMLLNARLLMQQLLQRLDRMLMVHSIEGRVPFLENGLFDFALNLPLRHKLRGRSGKHLLKQVALRYLPREVVTRGKMGFTVPWLAYTSGYPKVLEDGFVAEWTGLPRKDLQAWCHGDAGALYKLIAIEVWGRLFVYRQPWQDIRIVT